MTAEEPALDPARPIIDPHLHHWDIPARGSLQQEQRFLLPETLAMIERSGQNVTHTVFVQCGAMYRADGPEELRPVGETEFVNGIAAMAASGRYGSRKVAHRIVGTANLLLGTAVAPVLEAHVARAGERFRGIRMQAAYSDEGMFGHPCDPALKGLLLDPRFREGARVLAGMDLTLDVWCVHTQLDDLISLADALPELTIILDHIGIPETQGRWATRAEEARQQWAPKIAELARRPNVVIKLGGLGMDMSQGIMAAPGPATSEELAPKWRPYVETCIAAFSPQRAMFESNFPPDQSSATYGATWNTFKRIAAGCSEEEKDHLFCRTAARTYRIDID